MSGWDQDRVAEALRRGDKVEAYRIMAEHYLRADNLRSPFGYRPNPGYGVRQAPGTIWQDGQGLVIEGEFKVVSYGR